MNCTVTLQPGREKSLLRRHPWIFASAIKHQNGKAHMGDTVDVLAADGRWLARGAWSPDSQIRVRVWTFSEDEIIDNGFFLRRIERALSMRQALSKGRELTAWRLVGAESDGLPGITIDVYGDVLVCQLLSAGADKHRDKLVWALNRLLPGYAIHERSDVAVREKEGLPQQTQTLSGEVSPLVEIQEHGYRFLVDVKAGHKTGFYLDQKDNRKRIAAYAADRRVLNCFSYTGAMSVYTLAAGASEVSSMDLSQDALDLAQRHVELNNLDASRHHVLREDVFKALRRLREEEQHFDMIVLDPPKFVDSKQGLTRACRGYKDINLLAMQLLNAGGILATFSCSGLMPEELFRKVVADAALDAGREVQFLEYLTQSWDHPVSSAYPEGLYLKGLICRVI